MIRYGQNGRVSGLYLMKNIIQEGLIRIPKEGAVFDGRHHSIRDLQFSDAIRKEKELKDGLRKLTEDTVRLLYFLEADEDLKTPAEDISEALRPLFSSEDVTGMTFIRVFTGGDARLLSNRDKVSVRITEKLLKGFPGIEEKLISLIKRTALFSEEMPKDISVTVQDTDQFETRELTEGLKITLRRREQAQVLEEGDPKDENLKDEIRQDEVPALPSEESEELSEREKNVRKNFESELKKIASVISSLENEREEAWNERSFQNIVFSLPESAEEQNRPGVFRISRKGLTLSFLEFDKDEQLSERVLTEKEEDGLKRHILVRVSGGVQHLLLEKDPSAVITEEELENFTERIIRSIKWLQK